MKFFRPTLLAGTLALGTALVPTESAAVLSALLNVEFDEQQVNGSTADFVLVNSSTYQGGDRGVIASIGANYVNTITGSPGVLGVITAASGTATATPAIGRLLNGGGPGLGVRTGNGGDIEIGGAEVLTVSFDQSVIIPTIANSIDTAWWDQNDNYTLTVKGVSFTTNTPNTGFPGNANLATDFASLVGVNQGITGIVLHPGETITLTAAPETPDVNGVSNGGLEGIQLYVIPEPSRVALLALGLAGLVMRRRRWQAAD